MCMRERERVVWKKPPIECCGYASGLSNWC
jgi:hypothetical protein